MGGCCCSSRKPQFHGTPIYYYCPSVSEEHESLTSNDSAATALTTGFLVDLNLDTSIPDTYRSPPTPIPFDVVLGHPQSSPTDPAREMGNTKASNLKANAGFLKNTDRELLKSDIQVIRLKEDEETDSCPTCLEGAHLNESTDTMFRFIMAEFGNLMAEYDEENPRITAKCNHHFHLSCILEWMERSDTCPICDQEMDYEPL